MAHRQYIPQVVLKTRGAVQRPKQVPEIGRFLLKDMKEKLPRLGIVRYLKVLFFQILSMSYPAPRQLRSMMEVVTSPI